MQNLKKIKDYIWISSPGYDNTIEEERSKTSKILYSRSRVSFLRMWAPGIHIEGEEYIFDKRLKGGFLRNFRYLGPRGEILFYFFFVLGVCTLFKNNLTRERAIESLLNDRNVYFKVDLPIEHRKIN